MKYKIFFTLSILCCVSLCLSGCGKPGNPDGRLDVSGKITLNGGSFEGAEICTIKMIPLEDNSSLDSPSTTFNSKNGSYLFTMQDGLKPGKYKVSIMASALYDKKTKKPVTPQTGELDEYRVQLVPPEFNKNTTLEFEVVKGQKNVFDYDVAGQLNFDQ